MRTNESTDKTPSPANLSRDPDLRMDSPYVVGTKYWHRLEDGREQCDLCPRFCKFCQNWDISKELGPDVPMHFTAFHPDFRMLDKPATPRAALNRARKIALDNGVRYAYTRNVYDPDGQSTFCHICNELLIGRVNYEIREWNLTSAARCPKCSARCAGLFAPQPGHWGSRRLPVRLSDYATMI